MTGTIINAAGILVGGILGLFLPRLLSTSAQLKLKTALGLATVIMGIQIMWTHMGGGFWQAVQQFMIVMLAMILGRLLGRQMRIQKGMNWLGAYAGARFAKAEAGGGKNFNEGFLTGTILFCVAPIGIVGAILDGSGHWGTLAVKTVLDALATMAFVGTFGWGVLLAVIPVVAWQGSIALATNRFVEPFLGEDLIIASLSAVCGMIVMSVSVVIFEVKKVELGDYMPSLALAPLITWLWFF